MSSQSTDPVMVSFPLLTDGKDPELDAIHIVVTTFKQLDGDQIGRILEYLLARYTLPEQRR